jgi:hypothetical protein
MTVWQWGVILSGLFSAGALSYLFLKRRSLGNKPYYSIPRGNALRGVAYAFGRGMMPQAKESTRLHIFSYLAGMTYHLGIFCGFGILFFRVFSLHAPAPGQNILRVAVGLGLLSGVGLLFKRILMPKLRRLSQPDDFGANIIVDIFLASALAASLDARAVPLLLGYSIFLFLYIPVGKIRHCVFFFYSRFLFGFFFGRRGVLPPGLDRS